MLTRTKVFSLTIAALLILTLAPGPATAGAPVRGPALTAAPTPRAVEHEPSPLPAGEGPGVRAADAENVELVGQLVRESTKSVAVQGDYAYIDDGPRLTILDISDPASPTVVGKTPPLPDIVQGVAVAGDYAYVAAGYDGLRVVDVSDPSNPTEVGSYDTPGYAEGVAVAGGYAYVADGDSLRVVNVSTPTNPTEVGFYDTPGYACGVAVAGSYAYVAGGSAGLRVLDVSDPAHPTSVGSYDTPGSAGGVTVAGGYAYVADGSAGLRVVDVSIPSNPTEVGFYDTPGRAVGVAVAGGYAYVVSGGYLRVVDVSNPANPTEVGSYGTPGDAYGVAVAGDYAYIADGSWGLRVVDVSTPANPTEVGFYAAPSAACGVAVAGDYAYVPSCGEDPDDGNGIWVVDISDRGNPTAVGFFERSRWEAWDVVVVGRYAYAVDYFTGFHIVDISTPSNPTRVGWLSWGGAASFAVARDYAYVTNFLSSALWVVDVSTPSNPTRVGQIDMCAYGVAVQGDYVYVGDCDGGLHVIDISTPADPTEVGFYDTSGGTYMGVAVQGDYAYVADAGVWDAGEYFGSGLRVMDISTPTDPTQVGFYDTPGSAMGVAIAGGYAYVTDDDGGLRVVDVSDPANPTEVGFYDTPGDARGVAVAGGYVYVADDDGGLIILRFTGGEPPCNFSKQPVLLVPGWGGSAANLAEDENLAFFRDWLGTDYAEDCNLFYTTGLSAAQNTSENALATQTALHAAYDTRMALDPTWDGHFDIIAHSYGGINSRAYLESNLYTQDQGYGEQGIHVDNLFTLGTPHGGGTPELPGALLIAAKRLGPDDRESLWQLTPWAMYTFNKVHSQPDDICYRLIGGHAFEQNHPGWLWYLLRLVYGPLQFIPNDLGVYRWSAHVLASWDDRYPHVLVGSTPDMHGYKDIPGFDQVRSYVHPADTFDAFIGSHLGDGLDQCVPENQYQSILAESAVVAPPVVPSILITSGAVVSGTVVGGSFPVNWSDQSVFYLNWPLGDLDLSLTNPNGDLIDPTTAQTDPNVDYLQLDALAHIATYVFTDTLTGTWNYTITGVSVPYTVPYRLIALPSLPVAVTAQASPWQPQGQAASISGTLTYSATTPLTGAAVQAFIYRPNGALDTIDLYDDGAHDDQAAGDGIYGNSYAGTDVGGFYAVVVQAAGVYQTQPYTRTVETSFSVATGAASLAGQYSDQPRDANGDGRYEWLDVTAQISVTQVGTYTLAADLVTGAGSYIGHALLRTGLLTGTHSLTLSFDGDDILESGADGPYTLTNVLLVDAERASLLLDQADDVYTTPAYDHRQFDSVMRIYLPLILRNY